MKIVRLNVGFGLDVSRLEYAQYTGFRVEGRCPGEECYRIPEFIADRYIDADR